MKGSRKRIGTKVTIVVFAAMLSMGATAMAIAKTGRVVVPRVSSATSHVSKAHKATHRPASAKKVKQHKKVVKHSAAPAAASATSTSTDDTTDTSDDTSVDSTDGTDDGAVDNTDDGSVDDNSDDSVDDNSGDNGDDSTDTSDDSADTSDSGQGGGD